MTADRKAHVWLLCPQHNSPTPDVNS
jgi:hypothetical protein